MDWPSAWDCYSDRTTSRRREGAITLFASLPRLTLGTSPMLLAALAFALLPVVDARTVLKGLDPVELTQGKEVAGDAGRAIDRDGLRYLFSSDETRAKFEAEPERFEIQFGGSCASMGPMSSRCKMDVFAVHAGRIYVFASAGCKKDFLAAPDRHLDVVEPPLAADEAARKRGRELVDLALRGLGGAEKVDAVQALKLERSGPKVDGGKTYATRETVLYRFPGGIRTESAWDDWVYSRVATDVDAFQGSGKVDSVSPTGLAEFHRQLGREPIWILRHRGDDGFEAIEAGQGILRVRLRESITDLHLDPASGQVVRASWKGRLDSGMQGDVVVDFSDFREVSGLALSHARETRFDGKVSADQSGPFTKVEVDPEIPPDAFERKD